MDSREITLEQAEQVKARIGPMLRYLGRLRDRMEQELRFPPSDKLLQDTTRAYDALYALNVELHYMTCDPGSVWLKPKQNAPTDS